MKLLFLSAAVFLTFVYEASAGVSYSAGPPDHGALEDLNIDLPSSLPENLLPDMIASLVGFNIPLSSITGIIDKITAVSPGTFPALKKEACTACKKFTKSVNFALNTRACKELVGMVCEEVCPFYGYLFGKSGLEVAQTYTHNATFQHTCEMLHLCEATPSSKSGDEIWKDLEGDARRYGQIVLSSSPVKPLPPTLASRCRGLFRNIVQHIPIVGRLEVQFEHFLHIGAPRFVAGMDELLKERYGLTTEKILEKIDQQ